MKNSILTPSNHEDYIFYHTLFDELSSSTKMRMSKQIHSASSGRWLKEHFGDKYVSEAKRKGCRSRVIFKVA
ncbi:hypothetical protein MACH09_22780 [Vibrio sp. MACH09]|nr:hypothetical protein MACH09_22780 [Vibrio sp. MACH09]